MLKNKNLPSVPVGSKIDIARPVDPRALSGEVELGSVVLVDGKVNLVIGLAPYAPGTHGNSPVKEHLSALAIHTPNGVVWVGAPTLWVNADADRFTWVAWDRRPRTVQDESIKALIAEVANF
jgi:hypothetical protein